MKVSKILLACVIAAVVGIFFPAMLFFIAAFLIVAFTGRMVTTPCTEEPADASVLSEWAESQNPLIYILKFAVKTAIVFFVVMALILIYALIRGI